jgi:hypothetical protein
MLLKRRIAGTAFAMIDWGYLYAEFSDMSKLGLNDHPSSHKSFSAMDSGAKHDWDEPVTLRKKVTYTTTTLD